MPNSISVNYVIAIQPSSPKCVTVQSTNILGVGKCVCILGAGGPTISKNMLTKSTQSCIFII